MAHPAHVAAKSAVAVPTRCRTRRRAMAATRGEHATYGVGAFLACVSRVRDGAARRDGATARRRDGATLYLFAATTRRRANATRDGATREDARTDGSRDSRDRASRAWARRYCSS
tara:strand:- start:3800 stop:4144 length:345 start_codon:yes stop_codon:yes gene_type:complete